MNRDAQIVQHKCFTVSGTAYLRNVDRNERCIAIHYQRPPEKTEAGLSIGLRFPFLIVAGYVEDADNVAAKVARILNRQWDGDRELIEAVAQLTFAARTSGGTAGADASLMAACERVEALLREDRGGPA